MMRKILPYLMIVSIFFIAANIRTTNEEEQLFINYSDSIVNIQGKKTVEIFPEIFKEGKTFGSGSIINKEKGWILTANHCVKDINDLKLRFNVADEEALELEIIAKDEENDLAIIKINPEKIQNRKELKLANSMRRGQKIISIGNPLAYNKVITSGIIGSNVEARKDLRLLIKDGGFISDLYIYGGSSGSPVLNYDGEIVGMISSFINGFSVSVPHTTIKKLIDSIN